MAQGVFDQAACVESSSVKPGKSWMDDMFAETFDTKIALESESEMYSDLVSFE